MIIITDTASDILESEAKAMNIELITLSSSFEDETIEENTEESFEKFYKKLEEAATLPASSQPSPDKYLTIFENAKEKKEDVLVITISSKLSVSRVISITVTLVNPSQISGSTAVSLSPKFEYIIVISFYSTGYKNTLMYTFHHSTLSNNVLLYQFCWHLLNTFSNRNP